MPNELIGAIFALLNFACILLVFKFLGRIGLYVLTAIMIIYANIQVNILVDIFGMEATLGNVLYGSTFLITDILSERYGKKAAQKGVIIGFFTSLLAIAYIFITTWYTPAAQDISMENFKNTFSLIPRITLASLAAYIVSQNVDVLLFHFIKGKSGGKMLWLRNNIATVTSQFIDTAIFVFAAFWGVYTFDILISILLTTFILKFIVALLDTPFLYVANKITPNDDATTTAHPKTT